MSFKDLTETQYYKKTKKSFNKRKKIIGDCWMWQGHIDLDGYGRTNFNGKSALVHRVAYEIYREKPEKMCVCHSCNNKSCFNPKHLNLVSFYNHDSRTNKLREEDIRKIREKRKNKEKISLLAKEFNVHHATIKSICSYKSWKHVL